MATTGDTSKFGSHKSTGAFGGPNAPKQCTAMSKRSGQQCKGPAVAGSRTQKCRMHGGKADEIGPRNKNFKTGRHSKYLPARLGELYEEALSNPDLLDMADHIALLEARIQEIMEAAQDGDPIPHWSDLQAPFNDLRSAVMAGKAEEVVRALDGFQALIDAGSKWDRAWDKTLGAMEQLRKMTDTEVKRKKELNQMIPVERVVILMAAVGTAVKRHVTDPDQIAAVYKEIATLHGGTSSNLASASVINISPESKGPSGGRSIHAINRTKRLAEATE